MKGPDKPKLTRAMSNEIWRLFQGIVDIKVTYTCFFIHNHEVHQDRKVTYIRIVCDIRPQKKEIHRVQLTVGGEKLYYYGPFSTPTSDLTMVKLHRNSVLSTPDGKYLILDVKNFYLKIQ